MVTIEPPVKTGKNTMLLRYSSDLGGTPTFYIYVDGVLVAQTIKTEYELAVNFDENYMIEIFDSADEQPMQMFPGKMCIGWFSVPDTEYYRIDEYVGGEWVERRRTPDNNAYLKWESRFLEDGQAHQFRVVPVGENRNEGTPRQFQLLMVRYPDVPDVGYEYNAGSNDVAITEN